MNSLKNTIGMTRLDSKLVCLDPLVLWMAPVQVSLEAVLGRVECGASGALVGDATGLVVALKVSLHVALHHYSAETTHKTVRTLHHLVGFVVFKSAMVDILLFRH